MDTDRDTSGFIDRLQHRPTERPPLTRPDHHARTLVALDALAKLHGIDAGWLRSRAERFVVRGDDGRSEFVYADVAKNIAAAWHAERLSASVAELAERVAELVARVEILERRDAPRAYTQGDSD